MESVLGAKPIHVPLKYRCLMKITKRIRHIYLDQIPFIRYQYIHYLSGGACFPWNQPMLDQYKGECMGMNKELK